MGFSALDGVLVGLYLVGVTVAGILIGRRQDTARDYFLGGKDLSWWAVGFSIVASETSTLTFVSVPGLAFKGNLHFMQLVAGYFVGRIIVALVLLPAYHRGDLETAYDFLGRRFGLGLRRATSTVFIVTRVLASGVRLFATAIPVHLITGFSYPVCILLIGGFTLLYTWVGGLKAVVAMDVVQMAIYLGGAAVAMGLILHRLPHGWADVLAAATAGGGNKLSLVNLGPGGGFWAFLCAPYTLLGGLLGGTFMTMASHGTDQLLVQRLLGCRSCRDSQRALILDAAFIALQFAFFLVLGLCLHAYYGGATVAGLGLRTSDEVFPKFIVENLPPGLAGLVVAGVLASAMGTLSSSISSLASATHLDLFRPSRWGRNLDARQELRWSRAFTLLWGLLLIGGAMLFTDTRNPVVELGLKIASLTYGGLLGTFFLGLFAPRARGGDAALGFACGLAAMAAVLAFTRIDFTWHTLLGCAVTYGVGQASAGLRARSGEARPAPQEGP